MQKISDCEMKAKLTLTVLMCLIIASCEKNKCGKADIGEGFEIYLTVTLYSYRYQIDYNTIDFDTIELPDFPILRYNDLLKYDTLTHKLTLRIPHDSLQIGDAGVYGRMFVVTVDKEPIYCGFKWPVISSVSCNWVFIEEPYTELDGLSDNEIVISCSSNVVPDPRLDRRIIDRLKADGKID
jgi:hypothetical protein